jgi:glycosyltransferase involved in cell wall biosynthesis
MKRKKLVHIIYSLNVAGAEKVCVNICDKLDESQYDIYIITVYDAIPLAKKIESKENIKIHTLSVASNRKFWYLSLKPFLRFKKLMKQISPDIIHSHLWGIGTHLLLGTLSKAKGKRFATIHTSEGYYRSNHWYSRSVKLIEKWVYRLMKFKLVSVSPEVAGMVKEELKVQDSKIICNGVDTEVFQKNDSEARMENYPVLIHIGRFMPAKNHWDIIKSLPKLKETYPKFKLLLLGDGVEKNVGNFCMENNLKDNVEFLGIQKDVKSFINQADIGLFPSSYEGLPLSLLEMMSCQLPVIISDIPVLKNITRNGACAEIVKVHDSNAICDKIVELSEDKIKMKLMGQKGRSIVLVDFSLNQMIASYNKLYQNSL